MSIQAGMRDRRGLGYALGAAVLFGASIPGAKLLLGGVHPVLMAGLLYLASGVVLGLWSLVRAVRHTSRAETRLARRDVPWLLAIVLIGGVLGPVLLMWGLARTPASTAALLLNLEGALTALLAWLVFREDYPRRLGLGLLAILAGSLLLSWAGTPEPGPHWGGLAILAACAAWALDNNLTRRISAADPVQIVAIKGLGAGTTNVALALGAGVPWPAASSVLWASVLGLVCYGLSLVLFIRSLRQLGSARTGAYTSCAPFIGAALSLPLLGERPSAVFAAAAMLMGLGLWLHATERHIHRHVHPALAHDHAHEHDEHHQHEHEPGQLVSTAHAHRHEHPALEHSHRHYPDIHHRHEH